jgi:ABC-type transporter Mla subunit MlaD
MATQTDPVQTLAAAVNRLYDMSGNTGISAAQQQQLLTQAHSLRGDLVALVQLQFDATDAGYQQLMQNLNNVTDALNESEQKVQDLINKIAEVVDVAAAVDNLLNEAIQLGTTAAKLSVA